MLWAYLPHPYYHQHNLGREKKVKGIVCTLLVFDNNHGRVFRETFRSVYVVKGVWSLLTDLLLSRLLNVFYKRLIFLFQWYKFDHEDVTKCKEEAIIGHTEEL